MARGHVRKQRLEDLAACVGGQQDLAGRLKYSGGGQGLDEDSISANTAADRLEQQAELRAAMVAVLEVLNERVQGVEGRKEVERRRSVSNSVGRRSGLARNRVHEDSLGWFTGWGRRPSRPVLGSGPQADWHPDPFL